MKEQYSLNKCNLCPRNCNVDRNNKLGYCKVGNKVKVALVSIHDYEEPCISGKNGSGTIFFSGCNLGCVYCQNFQISDKVYGKEISVRRLADIMLEQQTMGVHNINLVTPTMYVDSIIEAIKLAKQGGLNIPIVYNSSGYEKVETLKKLEGYIDIYLPDFKYYNNDLGKKYSNVKDYFEITTKAIKEMRRQVKDVYDKDMMKTGLIIRHMILPGNVEDTKNIIKWIKYNLGNETVISIMAQYFPTYNAYKFPEINRKISKEELSKVEDYIFNENMLNGYIQELGEHEEEYVPTFNLDNV